MELRANSWFHQKNEAHPNLTRCEIKSRTIHPLEYPSTGEVPLDEPRERIAKIEDSTF